jgi:hypothetical protein
MTPMWIVLPTMPRPDAPVAGPGAQTLESEPKLPAAGFELVPEAGADALLLLPPLGFEELERPHDVATTPRVTATVTTPSSLER